jgi:hypothetical protein
VPERFRLQLQGVDGPRAGLPYRFVVDGAEAHAREGATDGDGWIEEWIPPRAREARIALGDPVEEVLVVGLGQLQPPDSEPGARARLLAAGLLPAIDADAALYHLALLRFQLEKELPASGELDAATADALRAHHGS